MFPLFRRKRDFQKLIDPIKAKLRAAGVRKLGFFGSFARGEEKPGSDVDVLVELEPNALRLKNLCDVGDILEGHLHRRADLAMEEGMRPHWKKAILPTVKYVQIN